MEKVSLYKTTYNGKDLFYCYLGGYTVYVNQKLINDSENPYIKFPINGDIVKIGNTLVLVPGNKFIYYFELSNGEILYIDCDGTGYSKKDNEALIVATNKVKLKWINTEDPQEEWIVLLHENGFREFIPNERILDYV